MEKNVITAQKDTSIFDLVDMFVENNVNAIPIVQDDKEIIGIVTDADLLYKEVKPCVPQYVNLLGANIYYGNLKEYQQGFKKLFACTAEQLMTKKVIMAGPDVREGVVFERRRIIDEAPTFAALLHFEMPQATGRAITEILR